MAKLVLVAVLWATAGLTIWVHFLIGSLGALLGHPAPGSDPGLPVTPVGLLVQSALLTLPIPAFASFARPRIWRLKALSILLGLWIAAAWVMLQPFTPLLDQPFSPADPFEKLFWHPVATPLSLVALFLVAYHVMTRPLRSA